MTGATKIYFNFNAEASANDFVDDFFFVAYATFLSQYGFYMWNENNISRVKSNNDASNIPFKLSAYYIMVREYFMKKLMYRWCFFLVGIYVASGFCYLITFTSLKGAVNSEG